MTILTDELIEKAALAMRDRPRGVVYDPVMDRHRLNARACLEAILPDIVEKCAQTAEGELLPGSTQYRTEGAGDWSVTSFYGKGRIDSAASIRSLLNKEGNAND